MQALPHAVARLRTERLSRCTRPSRARGSRIERCTGCRVPRAHCLCAWRPRIACRAGIVLLMHDTEALKPSNTGWLIADVVPDTAAFAWARTAVDARLPALLADPQRQPSLVFPAEYAPQRAVRELPPADGRRPLFVLLDATWPEARQMFRKSPYLDGLPLLGLQPAQLSRYRLRRARRPSQLCTAEVAALCLELAGERAAARALDAWLDAFIAHVLDAKGLGTPGCAAEAHARLEALS